MRRPPLSPTAEEAAAAQAVVKLGPDDEALIAPRPTSFALGWALTVAGALVIAQHVGALLLFVVLGVLTWGGEALLGLGVSSTTLGTLIALTWAAAVIGLPMLPAVRRHLALEYTLPIDLDLNPDPAWTEPQLDLGRQIAAWLRELEGVEVEVSPSFEGEEPRWELRLTRSEGASCTIDVLDHGDGATISLGASAPPDPAALQRAELEPALAALGLDPRALRFERVKDSSQERPGWACAAHTLRLDPAARAAALAASRVDHTTHPDAPDLAPIPSDPARDPVLALALVLRTLASSALGAGPRRHVPALRDQGAAFRLQPGSGARRRPAPAPARVELEASELPLRPLPLGPLRELDQQRNRAVAIGAGLALALLMVGAWLVSGLNEGVLAVPWLIMTLGSLTRAALEARLHLGDGVILLPRAPTTLRPLLVRHGGAWTLGEARLALDRPFALTLSRTPAAPGATTAALTLTFTQTRDGAPRRLALQVPGLLLDEAARTLPELVTAAPVCPPDALLRTFWADIAQAAELHGIPLAFHPIALHEADAAAIVERAVARA